MHKFLSMVLAGAALWATGFAAAQQPAAAPFKVHQLSSNVYWVDGGVSNSGVIVGDRGVIVIDTKMTVDNGRELLADVAKITPKPVTTVILTHRDIDHVGGLPAFPKGVEIIAHAVLPNKPQSNPPGGGMGGPGGPGPGGPGPGGPGPAGMQRPVIVQPTRVITSNKEDLEIDGVKLELLHWAPAHTSGDTVIYLPEQKIIFAGDILAMDFPGALIHPEQHGSSLGWIETAKGVLSLDADRIVPGHGDVQGKQTLQERLTKAETERAEIVKLVAQGKSLAEVEAAVGDPGPDQPRSQGGGPHFAPYSEVVYNELTEKNP